MVLKPLHVYFIWVGWEKLLSLNYNIPPLGVLRIAGSTPPPHHVDFTDEMVSTVDLDNGADIVAMSFLTPAANRAYQLAEEFRKRGKYIVMGGAHTTIMPGDTMKHADSIFIGEAEDLWLKFLFEYQEGNPLRIYQHEKFPDPEGLPLIRRDLLPRHVYPYQNPIEIGVDSIELSRGCTSNCAFCMVPRTQGPFFRNIPLGDIIRQYEAVSTSAGFIFFTDNNLLGNWSHTETALKALIPFQKDWIGLIAPEDAVRDPAKLDLMVKSGLCGIYGTVKAITGRESKTKLRQRRDRLRKLRDCGVTIIATFAFGWDDHDADVFDRTVDYCFESQLTVPEFIINTPFPGSRQFELYREEHRIITWDWSKYNGNHAVFKPKLMSPEELEDGYRRSIDRFYAGHNRDEEIFEGLKYRAFEAMIRIRKKQLEEEEDSARP